MDLATLIGLLGAAVLVSLAVILGSSPDVFLNPTGLVLVVGGTTFGWDSRNASSVNATEMVARLGNWR